MFAAGVAGVAVAAAKYHIDKPYQYLIPASLADTVQVGVRVMVPFGGGNRPSEGIILSVSRKTSTGRLKTISAVLDPTPVVDGQGIRLALWMRERYFCTVFEALRTMLPAGVWFKTRYIYRLTPQAEETQVKSEQSRKILELMRELGGEAESEDIKAALAFDPSDALRLLIRRGIVELDSFKVRSGGEKTVKIVRAAMPPEELTALAKLKKGRAPLQSEVLNLLAQTGVLAQKELCYFTGASSATIKALEKQGAVAIEQQQIFRRPKLSGMRRTGSISLNSEQQAAFKGMRKQLRSGKAQAALLYGVTGSGKTSVYIKLIKETLEMGRRAMVLVPEISLTPQLVSIFTEHFGDKVAVLHSSLRPGERYDEYKRIKAGDVWVIVGTRSAVFAPAENLGLIILDEEHERTYKSESAPRYHARDIAKYRCAAENALLVMGSATPSIESMYSAQEGKYSLYKLTGRYNACPLPQVLISDMRIELKSGNDKAISRPLLAELEKNIKSGEQSILFINRRGSSRMVTCVSCGHVPVCPRCSVALTYHGSNGRLMCHYCNYSEQLRDRCPECGGELKFIGYGTQRVEQELKELLPSARLLRMDADTVSATNTHEAMLSGFGEGEADILIGTQMVTKGLDFENVTLVGVLDADMSLYADDFRAAERTFSLITQVIGRAGRGEKSGRALIQTFSPENEVILLAARQDYEGFYERESQLRESLGYPPFSEIFTVTAAGREEDAVMRAAVKMRDVLTRWAENESVQMRILGPAPARIARINNRYRCRLTITGRNDKKTRWLVAALIKAFSSDRENRMISFYGDLNPLED